MEVVQSTSGSLDSMGHIVNGFRTEIYDDLNLIDSRCDSLGQSNNTQIFTESVISGNITAKLSTVNLLITQPVHRLYGSYEEINEQFIISLPMHLVPSVGISNFGSIFHSLHSMFICFPLDIESGLFKALNETKNIEYSLVKSCGCFGFHRVPHLMQSIAMIDFQFILFGLNGGADEFCLNFNTAFDAG